MSDSALPQGWTWAPLGDLVRPVLSKDPAREPDVEITYFDIGSIDNDAGIVVNAKRIAGADAPSRARQIVQEGDVLFSTVRPYLRATAQVPSSNNGVASTGFCVLRPVHSVSAKYLYFLSRSDGFLDKLLPLQRGVSYPAVRDGDVLGQLIPVAPSAEQIRIVEKLEELLSDLDAGVAELKAAQKKLAQYRQSLLKAAVEGALTAEWRAERARHGEAGESGAQLLERILRERRASWEAKQLAKFKEQSKAPPKGWRDKYVEPIQPNAADFPALPDGWVWTSLGQCFRVAVGATPSRKEPTYWNGDIPWVSSGEVCFSRIAKTRERISDIGLSNSSTQVNPKGSVLLGMIGEGKTRGQVAILDIEAANNQNCAAIWVSETDIPSEYIYFWLWSRYDETRRGSSGNNQPALNKSIVESIPFPLPPPGELNVLAGLIDMALSQVSEQTSAVAHGLKQAVAQRKNILKAAFCGQLVPQDPSDEPASVLLERIRAERESGSRKSAPRTRNKGGMKTGATTAEAC